jgi:hypothetical protein
MKAMVAKEDNAHSGLQTRFNGLILRTGTLGIDFDPDIWKCTYVFIPSHLEAGQIVYWAG